VIVEAVRMIAAVLEDPTNGVNALLASMPRDGADPRPANVTVLNAADDDINVGEGTSTAFPYVIVDIHAPLTAPGQVMSGVRDYEVPVLVGYVVKGGTERQNFASTDYTMRAIAASLARGLLAAGKRDTAGTRNNCRLFKASDIRYGPTEQQHNAGIMTGGLTVTLTLRDITP
jgi:hypothetical protein